MKRGPRFVTSIATCGPIGRLPVAPGTFGSLPGLAVYALFSGLHPLVAALGTIGLIFMAVWAAGKAETALCAKDPGCIVIDEVAGMTVMFFALPFDFFLAAIGFALFRLLDVLKPFPVGYLDRTLKGGVGIVMDDVAAGLMGNLLLHGLCWALPGFFAGN